MLLAALPTACLVLPAAQVQAAENATERADADSSNSSVLHHNTETAKSAATFPSDTQIATNLAADTDTAAELKTTFTTIQPQTTQPEATQRTHTLDSDSIQYSLMRLAQFYQQHPSASTGDDQTSHRYDSLTSDSPVTSSSDDTASANLTSRLADSIGSTLTKLAPSQSPVTHRLDNQPRCVGQWVYPPSHPNYPDNAAHTGYPDDSTQTPDTPQQTQPASPDQPPVYAVSDYGYYDNINHAELSGDVTLQQGSQLIQADQMLFDTHRNVAYATGQVLFTDAAGQSSAAHTAVAGSVQRSSGQVSEQVSGWSDVSGIIGVADSLGYDLGRQHATAKDVAFASVPMQAHGYAEKMNKVSSNRYELDKVMFTTCPPTDRKWRMDAKSIDLDTQTGRGEAYNTTFRIADVPVFYLPYFNFPIDSRRSSGFLLPQATVSTDNGIELELPYYLNLAPNYDATLSTRLYTNRNPMLTGEFRYLTQSYGDGQITAAYLAKDRQYNDNNRSSLFYQHHWDSANIPHLSADTSYGYVSDRDYLSDFDSLGLADNTLNLPRRASVNYYDDHINGQLKVETFQSLDALNDDGTPIADKDRPYARLPQLSLNYRLPFWQQLQVTGSHDSAYFKKSINDDSEAEKSGFRMYNKLSASTPLESSWGYITPKVSLQHVFTSYDEDSLADNNLDENDGTRSAFVPQLSVDAGLHLYQAGSPFGWYDHNLGGYQLLSPRLKYSYAPYKDQSDIPNFNTRIASINYEQLYADSWFLGHDRLQDLHAVTPGVNYRYIDANGLTRFDASIAEQFYIDSGRVTLQSNLPSTVSNQPDSPPSLFRDSSSGLVWRASSQPYRNLWLDASGAFTNKYDINYATAQLRYQPSSDSLFNLGIIERKQDDNTNQLPLSAYTASAIFPVSHNWRVLAQGQYDERSDKMLDALLGIDYEDCCIGFAIYGRRYYNDLNPSDKPNQAIMAEIRLNGLGNPSSRLSRLLSNKVLGFEPTQAAWRQ